jgi:hypothetical protein
MEHGVTTSALVFLTKLLNRFNDDRFGDDNEQEALAAFRLFRAYCKRHRISTVDLTLQSTKNQFPVDQYMSILNRLRSPVDARVIELEKKVAQQTRLIARLRRPTKVKRPS